MNKKLVKINNLSVEFNAGKRAVNNANFTINKGEVLGVVGESGSGKSITALTIMRLLSTTSRHKTTGEVFYYGNSASNEAAPINLLSLSEEEVRPYRGKEIAMIFQEPMSSLNPVMRCGKQVDEAMRVHLKRSSQQTKDLTLELFEKVRLPEPNRIYHSYPHQLSGGQIQRVMIAMAMACRPKLLIADEPTTALDVSVQKEILDLLLDLKTELGTSILFITHDLGVVAQLADRVLVMHKGEIVEEGDVATLFKAPKHLYTKGLLACRPPLVGRSERLPTVRDFLEGKLLDLTQSHKKFANVITNEEHKARASKLLKNDALLKVENLNVWFPKKTSWFWSPTTYVKAVDDVSFEVFEGETLGLVGESGCGKTTLGRTLLKLTNASSGRVFFKGKEILSLSESNMRPLRKEMQIIFQNPYASLNPRLMVGKAIMEPMVIHRLFGTKKEMKEKAIELLELVGLEAEHFTRYPHEFSGGQRQRICIARALAVEPKFIVCDEAVSALDVSVQAQVLNLLMDLRERFKLTYIFISHDLSVVRFISDRIMVMKQGRLEEIGFADDVYEKPSSLYTKSLVHAIPKLGI